MSLLLGRINTNTIRLIGGRVSNNIMCYIHVTEYPITQGHATKIVDVRDYTIIPEAPEVPAIV